jgi:S-ribosylhomocysteine lyase LuxS involved in autoinducer biosynthesis
MKVQEAKYVCKDHSKWKKVISAYPNGKRTGCYVCMYVKLRKKDKTLLLGLIGHLYYE